MAHLGCDQLTKSFRRRKVVDQVSIEIGGGEVVGLLGPNGAGKTTIFYMIVGLLHPNGGRIYLNGNEITDLPMYLRARKGIGYLPQEPSVFRKLTVEENLMAILETLPLVKEEKRDRLEELLDELGLSPLRRQKAYSLSGGERRRVEITRALVLSPSFILLDEPFAGIDPIAVLDIQAIVRQLKSKGIGIIITDHNVRETLGVCDRAYILNEGILLESGTPVEIARSPKARKIYLGDGFRLDERHRMETEEIKEAGGKTPGPLFE
jgi:lipopolysaccharide export system ATP-binding protein